MSVKEFAIRRRNELIVQNLDGIDARKEVRGRNILTETAYRVEQTPNVPSRLSEHPYFAALAERRWHGVEGYLRPRKVNLGAK